MKKLLTILAAVLLLSQCAKKSGPPPQNANPLTGEWLVTADTIFVYSGSTLTQTEVFSLSSQPFFKFNGDGFGTALEDISDVWLTVAFTYTEANNVIRMSVPGAAEAGGPYSTTRDKPAIFNYPGESDDGSFTDSMNFNVFIQQITATNLSVKFSNDVFTNGTLETSTEVIYMTKFK
jgi:hypothetical protein